MSVSDEFLAHIPGIFLAPLSKHLTLTMKTINHILTGIGILLLLVTFQNCAPVFSDMQSARLVGKGSFEVTPSYSTVNFAEEGESEGIQNHVGAQFALGLSDKVDLRARFEHIWLKEDGEFNEQIFGIGPKFSLVKDRIAGYLPVGFAFSDVGESIQIHPTLLFTVPIVPDKLDFNPSAKYLISFCDGCENLVAVNAGLAFSEDIARWALRAEYGLLYNPGESGHFGQFSVGFSYTFSKKQ